MDLIEQIASQEETEQAKDKLRKAKLSESAKEKIERIILESRYSKVYTEFFMAENPLEYRDELIHNQKFFKDVEELNLDMLILKEDIQDEGIILDIDNKNELRSSKIKRYLENIFTLGGEIRDSLLEYKRKVQRQKCIHMELERRNEEGIEVCEKIDAGKLEIKDLGEDLKSSLVDGDHLGWDWIKKDSIIDDIFRSIKDIEENGRYYEDVDYEGQEITIDKVMDLLVGDEDGSIGCRIVEHNEACKEFRYSNWTEVLKSEYEHFKEKGNLRICEMPTNLILNKFSSESYDLLEELESELFGVDESNFKRGTTREMRRNIERTYNDTFYKISAVKETLRHLDQLLKRTASRPAIPSKLKNIKSGRYFIKLESKLPEDVTFGNEAGCCIGIYPNDKDGVNNVPFYQLDCGTLIFGIYQQIKSRKPVRMGLALSFVTKDIEDKPVLLCNSYELSEIQTGLNEDNLNKLIEHINKNIREFSERAGFDRIAMGRHEYNTGINYMDKDSIIIPDYSEDELLKIPESKAKYYSEVLVKLGFSKKHSWGILV